MWISAVKWPLDIRNFRSTVRSAKEYRKRKYFNVTEDQTLEKDENDFPWKLQEALNGA